MKMVDDAGFLAKRLWSVRFAAIGVVWAAAGAYWIGTPDDWKPTLSEPVKWIIGIVGVALAAAPGLAALVHQPKLQQAKIVREKSDQAGA